MQEIGRGIDRIINPDPRHKDNGFVLLMFEFGQEGRMNYISNGSRQHIILALKELLGNFEKDAAEKNEYK